MLCASSPTTVSPRPSGHSRLRIAACSALVSWYSSTSTASNRLRTSAASAVVLHEVVPVEQQVVVVEHVVCSCLRCDVRVEQRLQLLGVIAAPREVRLERLLDRLLAFTHRL